jgi:hypothetical protein
MSKLTERTEADVLPGAATEPEDRRRPKRQRYRNPYLIALLRSKPPQQPPVAANDTIDATPYHGNRLGPARGIGLGRVGLGLLLSVVIWVILCGAVWMVWKLCRGLIFHQ